MPCPTSAANCWKGSRWHRVLQSLKYFQANRGAVLPTYRSQTLESSRKDATKPRAHEGRAWPRIGRDRGPTVLLNPSYLAIRSTSPARPGTSLTPANNWRQQPRVSLAERHRRRIARRPYASRREAHPVHITSSNGP